MRMIEMFFAAGVVVFPIFQNTAEARQTAFERAVRSIQEPLERARALMVAFKGDECTRAGTERSRCEMLSERAIALLDIRHQEAPNVVRGTTPLSDMEVLTKYFDQTIELLRPYDKPRRSAQR